MSFTLGNPKDFFTISGKLREFRPLKIGHIHDTWISWWEDEGKVKGYVHQRVNLHVFRDINALMNNINIVVTHIKAEIDKAGSGDRIFQIIPANDGRLYAELSDGEVWRTLEFIEDTQSSFVCSSVESAREAGSCCGRFVSYLNTLPVSQLVETIPNFHDAGMRYAALKSAVSADEFGRCAQARADIDFALEFESVASAIISARKQGDLPTRVAHNDLKFNNVLFSRSNGRAVAVVDLDTCMPGALPDDFGDFIRNTCVSANEDERDLSKISLDMNLYRAAVTGFLQGLKFELQEAERDLLPIAPAVLALTLGVRFLTDHLSGDRYFKIHRPGHNLDRARSQFQVFREIHTSRDSLRRICQEAL